MKRRDFLFGTTSLVFTIGIGDRAMAASTNPVDLAALAALRPGMPMSAVEKAMGSAWRAPAPHKGGLIDGLENTYGVIVRIDRNGLIGRIDFNSRFEQTIAGVPMGIKLADFPTTVPDMKIGEESNLRKNTRLGKMQLAEGELTVRITYDTVYDIAISNPTAEYEAQTAPPYPAASGAPGAPFSDPNLKLAVMAALLRSKMLDLGTPEQLASHVLARPVDLEQDGYELIPQALDYLVRYPLTAEQLASVDWVQFDGGEEIYPYAWYFWGGEEGVFDIHDTSDLHHCVNLKGIAVTSMIDSVDLRTLASLPKLEWIHIYVPTQNLEALLDMPSLKRVRRLRVNDDTKAILEKLEQRGIEVN